MAYQILSLRPTTRTVKGVEKTVLTDETHYYERWRVENPADIFASPQKVLDENKIPESERYNLFYTIAYCGEAKRSFARQDLLPIDIDGIDLTKIDTIEALVLDTLQLDPAKTELS